MAVRAKPLPGCPRQCWPPENGGGAHLRTDPWKNKDVVTVNLATLQRLEGVVGDVLQAVGDRLDVKPSERVSGPHIVRLAQLEMLIQPGVEAGVRRHQREAVRVPAVVDGHVPKLLLGVLRDRVIGTDDPNRQLADSG
jgi:hypothetical protein